ncbi:isopenicillin N synthase family dioxygenase [Arenicella xantha]|uniref:2-oxoglutarate-dependent ethylene/succinate-forming enzyme n=1 Tax=Arenicella xantha TaxID=644221 RepID=A0A395JNH1_9GAMM|nr:2-oxoglutarate and iron-dependent oxygenase domain-containing protein [Arenicella xantha]RBP52853.1 isopenicillin N synthase-like dioxygenase [Arenicella xantha]
MINQIPTLDISDFGHDPEGFTNAFKRAYTEWGFAGITGHGIDPEQIRNAFAAAQAFFALPVEKKTRYETDAVGRSRGYVPFGTEKAKDSEFSDLKEFYHVGREVAGIAHLAPNVWPAEITAFRSSFESLFTSLDDLAHRLLQVFALSLELPQDYFDTRVNHGEALLRILHYPPILDGNVPNLRAAAHEDINLLTLLVGSEQEGLEVLSRQGEWVPISMIKGTIICNVGDMLQRLSNGTLPSTTHRVVNPQGDKAKSSRYSIPFFMHPNPTMRLDCLPQCVTDDQPLQYPPITASDYLTERLIQIGLMK